MHTLFWMLLSISRARLDPKAQWVPRADLALMERKALRVTGVLRDNLVSRYERELQGFAYLF